MGPIQRWLLLTCLGFCAAWMDERPVLESRDGNLFISAARDRNISLKILGSGCVNVNEINLLHVASAAQNATRLIERWRRGYLAELETNVQRLTNVVQGPTGLVRRIALLTGGGDLNTTFAPGISPTSQPSGKGGVMVRILNNKVRRLEDKVKSIEAKLKTNECSSNPCQNGGSCQDLYEGYQCHCPSNWEGLNCLVDVNECVRLLGTDLGCQNGATCINLPGSYKCNCVQGWYGIHCTKKNTVCNTENSEELCGHGVCVSRPGTPYGYTCICDQGWQSDNSNPACTKDVDECAQNHPPCSVNPWVACRNAPGTFFCDSCPRGYTGNGYYCTDIDECMADNGGCSTMPRVQCINTMGSRMCGQCPTGYRGDGVTCIYVGGCAINNGGCHPLATCVENRALTSAYVLCRCPAGLAGDGIGPNGCQPTTDVSVNSACSSNPCIHGRCVPGATAYAYTCVCNPGYTGASCNAQADPCTPNPCKNNGACLVSNGAVACDCPSTFTGSRCETARQTCGGVSRNPVGHLEFPVGGTTYQHGLSCAWVVITNSTEVLNVTFTRFNLEHSADCKYDFLQIHDGRNAGSQMIGRFCGNTLPNGHGNIVSTHNSLYFWFHSDNSISHDGFSFRWNTIEPACGGELSQSYGTISSPGSPGRYPPNRDCTWFISVPPTKRIQFLFGQIMLEEHPTCANDYLEITSASEERLALYCNHTRPSPLITHGSEAVIHFHSDSAGQDSGFQIHYSVVEGVPGCGGVFTSSSGTITPPSHLNAYLPNMECEWKIQLPVGERIEATWSKFELESSPRNCLYDFVQVYDGDSRDAQLIGRYCGQSLPPRIKSNSNNLLIVFVSDWTYEMEGFAMSYNVLCGGEFTEGSGIIHSPMYPKTYHKSRTCNYEIEQPAGKRIVLNVVDLDIEGLVPSACYFDYLEVFDGDNENSTKLDTLCGDVENIPDDPYYSTHNYMFLRFTTDGTVQGRGFLANYTTIPSRCGGLFKAATGTIQTSNEDGSYRNDEDCIWTIQAPPGHVVQVTWLTFHLEHQIRCRHDYVVVYENYTSADRVPMGTYCGSKKPPILMTQGNVMTIEFHSDSSITYEGFVATYMFIDGTRVCGGHYTQTTGVIKSPNYPELYPEKRECVWVIEAPNKQRVILNVQDFELESNGACAFDYFEIRNGGYEISPLIGKFCGTDIPSEIISQTNQLYLKFVSDQSKTYKGFKMEWDSTTIGCGGIMNAANGDIVSPNYPQPYMQQADCTWKILVSAGSIVQLLIVELELEPHDKCRFDFIEISEGIDRRNGQRYCGSPYPKVVQSKSNMVTVRFRSDYTNSGRGFHLKYETLCQNKIHGFYGVIESPNFPNKYEHSLNCSWIIEAPVGNKINITFSHFALEGLSNRNCTYDYLDVKEGTSDTPNTDLMRLCGSDRLPSKIHSTLDHVFVTFVTDSHVSFNGFRFEWVVDGCGGHLTRPFGDITSPGYPSIYPSDIECEWLIEVDYSHSIELTIHDINMEKQMGCYYDKLAIFSGENELAPKLVEICYSEKPIVYTSFGNKMFMKFYSDSAYSAKGFNASYKSVPLSCGGRFTADTGIIFSTNYPKNYPNKQNCEWLIQVGQNFAVNLTFLDFDVEDSWNCTDDYVKIFDGPTRDSPLLGTQCRTELPPSYVSTGNEMLIVMKTDSVVSAKGFKARYAKTCGARIVVKDQGYLAPSTSRHGDVLEDNTNCTWTLIAEDPADHVTVTFTHMEINVDDPWWGADCTWNFIEVIEGERLDGPSVGKWCDNVVPLPVTSTGNALTVHLFSHYDFLGHFAVTYSVLNSACGGTYTSSNGKIASPGYPNSYPLNAECIWILKNSPGNKLMLTFSEFDIQYSENCDLDYLEIREDSGIGKLLANACGTSIETVRSSSMLWIKFKSDGTGVGKGFVGDYAFEAGNELTGPSGRISSPLYPMPYKQRQLLSWRITVQYGWLVQIEIKDLFIENLDVALCYSSLTIYNGYDNNAPVLAELCNRDIPKPVLSSSNVVYITMTTDNFRMGSWFDLAWIQIPKETDETEYSDVKLSNCTEEVGFIDQRNSTFAFTSPDWPHGYAPYLRCAWLFTSPPGTHLVLRILNMDLEETSTCGADFVAVYSGNALTSNTGAKLLEKLCLANATSVIAKTSNVMTVKFESDSYLNGTGFSAYVYRDCGGNLEGPNGVIEIDNSTSIRAIRTWQFTCEWAVEVKPGRTIEVKITEMSIQQGAAPTCSDNYLMLKNGGDATSPLLGVGKYCGTSPIGPLETIGNRLYVKAAGVRPNVSFKLTYREVSKQCGGEFVLSKKQKEWEISTPNYPNIPPPYTECTWTVIAPSRERISLHFVERFDLSNTPNCTREYVEVRDGGTDSSKVWGRFCKDVAPSSMTSTGNMMYVHFYTDLAEPKNGFKAAFTAGEVCGGILRGTTGTITSPNYPFFYQKNITCTWTIIAPTDHTLKIEFHDIHLPGFRVCTKSDHVEISEKMKSETETQVSLGVFCGTTKPEVIETSSNEAVVTFRSDNFQYIVYRGFSLNFVSSQEVCGGEFTALSGVIKSHGYPNIVTRSRYCDWKIKVPKGFHVVVDILDLDIIPVPETTRIRYALSFYNDFRFRSRIKVVVANSGMEQIRSSSNTMMIGYSSSPGYRGFKLRYTAQAPAPCGGVINEMKGSITAPTVPPFNESSYFCQWNLEAPEGMSNDTDTGLTLSVMVNGLVGGVRGYVYTKYCYNYQYISLTDIGMICGNFTEPVYLRSPKLVNELIIVNGTYGKPMHFTLDYEWQPCGGTLGGLSHVVSAPKNISYPINCAWTANYPDTGEMIKLSFSRLNLSGCDKNYISVRNGGPFAPEIGKFCGNSKPPNITSTSNQLWIEYFATSDPNDFEFILEPANNGCGGALRGNSREISSPEFPKQYPNNAECTWEITADNGYHVGLVFVDRFNLESSTNCEQDYVQVFDWQEGATDVDGVWKDLGKVCGRNAPSPFNSTSNRMKVIFHSNQAIQGDGFRARWYENCGGVFEVTSATKIIQSPSYPHFYQPNLFCNYTLVSPKDDFIVDFVEFQLERSSGECLFDNLTIHEHYWETNVWCGDNKPPTQTYEKQVELVFRTDKYIQRNGFVFKYFLKNCGGTITEPGEIKPLMRNEEYFGDQTCVWYIEAPKDKNVVLRFENFILEYNTRCRYDYVEVYDNRNVTDYNEDRLALLCGNLTEHLPVLKSTSNYMTVLFKSDGHLHFDGFSAKVLFAKSTAAGCGGDVNMTATRSVPFKTQKGSTYESLEDCHWVVLASPGKIIRLTINSMDLVNATNRTSSVGDCSGDYLEVRDGSGPFSELVGRYCGTQAPPPILSYSNHLWIRFFSDGTLEGAGVSGTLETVDSICGVAEPVGNTTKYVLRSPNYPNNYPPGTNCQWTLYREEDKDGTIKVHFLDFDVASSASCENDFLQITDSRNRKFISEGFGEDFVWTGIGQQRYYIMDTHLPTSSYKYCGKGEIHDFYSYSDDVQVKFQGDGTGHRGFELEYSIAGCDRNYTAEQGRILNEGVNDCWITITAPENKTISLYFNSFVIYDPEECTESFLRVFDGNFNSNLMATMCGSATPNPIFSTGNKLSLRSVTHWQYGIEQYDITYTTTSEGRGCGGRLFNYYGTFSSPMYPNEYRNNTECKWDVGVPRGHKVNLTFQVFDIGTQKNCDLNYLMIYDVGENDEEVLRSTFCGGDDPASFEAAGDRVIVQYTSTVNNVGTGWLISFSSQASSS